METGMDFPHLAELRKFVAPEFVFGPGAYELVGRYARNLGASRVMLVSDPGVLSAGWTDRVRELLEAAGLFAAVFTDVSPNPRDTEVMRAARLFQEERLEAIVAVGGGSPMDLAKAVGIVTTNGRHVRDFEGVDQVGIPGPPLVCIPTTAGSSADVSQFAIINDTARRTKFAIVSKAVVPDVALIDPVLTTSMGPELTAYTGLDAMSHAIEAYVSNASSPLTDLLALSATSRIAQTLPLVVERGDDLELRTNIMQGSLEAGLAFSSAILGAVHAFSHALGALLDKPHGLINAILMGPVMDYNFQAAPERYAAVARAMGAGPVQGEEARLALLDTLASLNERLGMPRGLADLGARASHLDELLPLVMGDPCMVTNPRQPTPQDIELIYEKAL